MSIYNYTGSNNKYRTTPDSGLHGMSKCMYESSLDYIKLDEAMLMSDFYEVSLNRRDSVLESSLGVVNEGAIGNFFAALKNMLVSLGRKIAGVFKSVINGIKDLFKKDSKDLKEVITVDSSTIDTTSVSNPDSSILKKVEVKIDKAASSSTNKTNKTNDIMDMSDFGTGGAQYSKYRNPNNPPPSISHKHIKVDMTREDWLLVKNIDGIELKGIMDNGEIQSALKEIRGKISGIADSSDINSTFVTLTAKTAVIDGKSPEDFEKERISKILEGKSTIEEYRERVYSALNDTREIQDTRDIRLRLKMAIKLVGNSNELITELNDLNTISAKVLHKTEKELDSLQQSLIKSNSQDDSSKVLPYIKSLVNAHTYCLTGLTKFGIRVVKEGVKSSKSLINQVALYRPGSSKQENAILMYESVVDAYDEVDELFAI